MNDIDTARFGSSHRPWAWAALGCAFCLYRLVGDRNARVAVATPGYTAVAILPPLWPRKLILAPRGHGTGSLIYGGMAAAGEQPTATVGVLQKTCCSRLSAAQRRFIGLLWLLGFKKA